MEIRQEQSAAVSGNGPWPYHKYLERDCPTKALLSSADRGWSGLSAELCTVRKGVIPWRTPQSDIRICFDVRGNESLVTRRAPGIESRIVARQGTVWLSPPGLQEGSIEFTDDMPGILHIYLPLHHFSSHFSPGNHDADFDQSAIGALSYKTAVDDPLLSEIGCAIASELQTETSAGNLLVGALACSMAARLLQKHVGDSATQPLPHRINQGLDRRRLSRVLNYIEANLEGDLSLDRMATIACLSRYHFARAFRQAVGQSPHRYVSAKRLERAKALLIHGDRSLVDIALTLNFSSQANFTRAFTQATGLAPGQFRRGLGSLRHSASPDDVRQAAPLLA